MPVTVHLCMLKSTQDIVALFAVECELNFPIVFATSYESTCPESSIAGAIAGALTAFGSVTILSISIIILASYYCNKEPYKVERYKENTSIPSSSPICRHSFDSHELKQLV